MLSVSILGIKDSFKDNIAKLDAMDIDYFHVDIMDGVFVGNKTWVYDDLKSVFGNTSKKLDVHLMVSDLDKYIDDFAKLNPEFITFHYEATSDHFSIIKKIREKNIKVGIAINPETSVASIKDLLAYVDLVLVMSVSPGKGGQCFIPSSTDKINELCALKKKNDFLISVDGGINDSTIDMVKGTDIVVVGSFITNGDYSVQISKLKKKV